MEENKKSISVVFMKEDNGTADVPFAVVHLHSLNSLDGIMFDVASNVMEGSPGNIYESICHFLSEHPSVVSVERVDSVYYPMC